MIQQSVIVDYPPIFEEIAARFPHVRTRRDVIYSWGGRIFNPGNIKIGPELWAHEAVHSKRQGGSDQSVREWWKRYLDEARFRLEEELPAHRAELCWLLAHGNRAQRRAATALVAQRLSGPLYGRLLTRQQAEHALHAIGADA